MGRTVALSGFGLTVTPLTSPEVVQRIQADVRSGRGLIIGNVNLHGLYVHQTDARFRCYIDQCDLVLLDGWPIVSLAGRADSGVSSAHRVGSTDWLFPLMSEAPWLDRPLRITAVGGTPSSTMLAAKEVARRYPRVEWRGHDGFEALSLSAAAVAADLEWADVVLVGMGMPRQEHWILDNLSALSGKVVADVGGCLDYVAGVQRLAPRWLGPLKLEWLYRLLANPGRLWRRYLLEPVLLGALLVRNRGGSRGRA